MKNYLLIRILLCTTLLLHFPLAAQYWGKNTESEFTNEANALAVDANGNTYIAGYITGETAFEINVVHPNAAGNGDIYIAKYNSSGGLVWVKQYGGNSSDRAVAIAVDNTGSVYVTGQFFGTVDFDGNIVQASGNSKDIFVAKLTATGTAVWAIAEGGAGQENAYGITTDQQNNVILTGQFSGAATIAGQNFVSINDPLTNLPSYDFFISKYSSSGNPLWVQTGVTPYEDRGMSVSCDDQNNIILVGQFSDTLTFCGQVFNNAGYNVGFVSKLNPGGQLQWLRKIKAGMLLPYSVVVNNSNEIIITGDYLGTLQYNDPNGLHTVSNSYYRKIFALKTDQNGNFEWGNSLGSYNEISARSIAVNTAKDLFITGYFSCDLSELHDPQPHLFNSVGFKDLLLWHLDNQGNSVYIKQAGSKKDDQGKGISIMNNQPVICGSYTDDLNIPPASMIPVTTSQQDFNLHLSSFPYDPAHFYLHGDDSRNSFLTNAIQSWTDEYDYFYPQGVDSLDGFVSEYHYFSTNVDTIHFCDTDSIFYAPNTYPHYGPAYTYLWNTGVTTYGIEVFTTGMYSVAMDRLDECSNNTDSAFVLFHLPPDLPSMSDSLGLAVNEPGVNYYTYEFCAPVSIPIWFNDLDSNLNIEISGPGAYHTDTLPHAYSNNGTYDVIVWDNYCYNSGFFTLDLDFSPPHDVIPYMVLFDTLDYNDSISVCSGNQVIVLILDSLNNPNGDFYLEPDDPVALYNWTIQPAPGHSQDTFNLDFTPLTTGWYTISYFGSFGYDNLCGLDTTNYLITDSFFVEVIPLPFANVTISGDNLICPDGSVYLTINQTYNGLDWHGPAINWISSNEDSVQVTAEGIYHYKGWLTDSITGCEKWYDFTFLLTEKSPPDIQANPTDGIICPYDSVTMWIDSVYVDYVWFGPYGDSLSLNNSHTDTEQGFYYVTVTDAENCSLTSPPFEIKEYSTPYLSVEPSNVLCENDSVTIVAIFDGNGSINWLSPIAGNNPEITVTQGGWYVCELIQCGITLLDSVLIIDGTFTPSISLSDSLLCFGEIASITTTPGMSLYEWSNGEVGSSSILVDQTSSIYATLTNAYGCTAQTDTVVVQVVENAAPPVLPNEEVCSGSDLTITNNVITEWYTMDTTFIASTYGFSLNSVVSDTSFLIAYATAECPLSFSEILITVIDSLPSYSISTPPGVCPQDSITLTIPSNGEDIAWFVNGVLAGNDEQLTVFGNDLVSPVIEVQVSNTCFTTTLSTQVTVFETQDIILPEDTLWTCTHGELSLTSDTSLQEVLWTGFFGQSGAATLQLSNPIVEGYIFVTGTDSNGCVTNGDSVYVATIDLNVSILSTASPACEGDPVSLSASNYGSAFTWQIPGGVSADSLISFTIDSTTAGWYVINVSDSIGCSYTDSVLLQYSPLPWVDLPEDSTLCMRDFLGGSIYIDSFTYQWTGYGIQDSIIVLQSGMYYLTVESPQGCIYKDSIQITVVNCDDPLPNVFTPNNDGVNDVFIIDEAPLYPNNTLIIVNRWGEIVFREDGYTNTFNGEGLTEGTYFYTFYREGYGNPDNLFEGHVTIIR